LPGLCRLFAEDQTRAVWGERAGELIVRAVGEALHRPRAVRGLPEEIVRPTSPGTEQHPLPVWCPEWMRIRPRIEGEARQRFPREIPDPDVPFLVAHVERHARPI